MTVEGAALDPDVVIVGGGIAGAAVGLALARQGISATILEFQHEYKDQVRGEALCPWGMAEAIRLGVSDAVFDAGPAPIRRWIQWDEVYAPEEAPTMNIGALCQTYVPGVDSAFALHHYKTCEALATAATGAGATLLMGVRDLVIEPGPRPAVRCMHDGEQLDLRPKMVVGAGGRNAPTARAIGMRLERDVHHWGGGLAVSGLDDWPAGVQAMGTEGHRMFFVFPQRNGRARLYLNFPTELRQRYAGPDGTRQFLQDFDLKCLPHSDMVMGATPEGPCMSSPSYTSRLDSDPVVEGVVLIGDEAGANDPVLGTGLSSAFRDARSVVEALTSNERWTPEVFDPYVTERRDRMRRLRFAAQLVATLSAEFGAEAVERRRRAWQRMSENPLYGVTMLAALAGPERLPEIAFTNSIVNRLLANEQPPRRAARLGLSGPQSRVAAAVEASPVEAGTSR